MSDGNGRPSKIFIGKCKEIEGKYGSFVVVSFNQDDLTKLNEWAVDHDNRVAVKLMTAKNGSLYAEIDQFIPRKSNEELQGQKNMPF